MPALNLLKRQINSAKTLHSVVRTMKTLAAVNIRHYNQATTSLASYAKTVELGLQIALRDHPEALARTSLPPSRVGAVIFGSDQGLCGSFNEQIVTFALETLLTNPLPATEPKLAAVGLRASDELKLQQHQATKTLTLPSSLSAITGSVQELLRHLDHWRQTEGVDQITLFYHRPYQTSYRPRKRVLFPVDLAWLHHLARSPWDSRGLPIYTMTRQALFSALIREYFFVTLYRALAESLASENAARLSAMQAAEDNINTRITELSQLFHQLRQTAITEELTDIIAGAEVLAGTG